MSAMGNTELLQIAEAVAREKGIGKESVLEAMEQAIQVAARRKYGHEHQIHVEIDRKTGDTNIFRVFDIVAEDSEPNEEEDGATTMSLAEAIALDPAAHVGGKLYEPLPPIDLGRVSAQSAKQVIVQKVRDAERERQYEDFKDRVGEIVNGVVKRIEYGNVTVDLGRAEGFISRHGLIRSDIFRQNDRIRAYVEDVRREAKGPQIFLSRAHNNFLAGLFAQEVPEIYDGVIEVRAVAREPGSRAKMAVYSRDSNIDPVGSCVGVRGSRVQAVIAELQGEKIDIIPWSSDPATFVVSALAPAEVSKVVIDEDKRRIAVIVATEQLSLAIGRRGQNVRLASQLTGWNIDVLTEDEESRRRIDEFKSLSDLFINALDVDEVLAQLLASEGFTSIEELAETQIYDLANIDGLDEDIANALRERAQHYLQRREQEMAQEWKTLGGEERLASLPGMNNILQLQLAKQGILTLENLADLSHAEFEELLPQSGLTAEVIDQMIMAARAICFPS
jgi:N utilization substance protein A